MGLDLGTLLGHIRIDGAAQAEQSISGVQRTIQQLSGTSADVRVGADTSTAEQNIVHVEDSLRRIVSKDTIAHVDAKVDTAQRNVQRMRSELDLLNAMQASPRVQADITTAQRQLSRAEQDLQALQGARATMVVEADTSAAEDSMDDLGDTAEDAGGDAGARAGHSLVDGMRDGLSGLSSKTGPLVGAVLGAVAVVASVHPGIKIVDAIMSDAARARQGLFSAQTGLDPATAARFGTAVGEAYANNFGESVEQNMDAAKAAVQTGLLGGDSTKREISDTIAGLTTVANIIGAEVPEVSRAAGQAIKTGLSDNASDALGLIVKGYQNGLDVSGDLLDTIDEYGTQFRKIGLDGPTALGLVSQAVKNGARDTDLAADAIKEFSIRSIDGSKTTISAYQSLGLNAQKMMESMSKGGPTAQAAMQKVFDQIRKVKDPVTKSQIAVELFGTQAEDLGAALNSFDLSKARKEFGDTAGVVDDAMSSVNDNAAAKTEQAKRSVEQAATGIENALASAFSPKASELADWVSSHQEAIVGFANDIGDALFTGAKYTAEFGATALDVFAPVLSGFGKVTDAALAFADGLLHAAQLAAKFTGQKGLAKSIGEARDNLKDTRKSADEFFDSASSGAKTAADKIRTDVVPAIDKMHEQYKDTASAAKAQAALSDAAADTAREISKLGDRSEGTALSGAALDKQAKKVHDSLVAQEKAAVAAGEGNKDLTARAKDARDAFVDQAKKMGLSEKAAEDLAKKYGLIPSKVVTDVEADTSGADRKVDDFLNRVSRAHPTILVGVKSSASVTGVHVANGQIVGFADGGDPGAVTGGTPGKDSVQALLMPGEHVWTTDEVQKAGGQGAMYRARQLARQGMLRFAKGGAVPTKWKGKSLEYWQDRYASGSDYLELKVAVRDDKRDLAEKETYKDKSGHKAKRYVLRGLDRQVASAKEREDQKALDDADTARQFVKKYGSFAAAIKARDNKKAADQKAADKKKSDDDKAAAKKADLAQQKADAQQAASRGDVVDEVASGLSGAYSAIDQVRDLASDTNLTKAQRKALNDTATRAERSLKALYKESDLVAARLTDAKAKADELAGIKSETSSSLQGGFSLASALGPQQKTDKYGNVWYDKASGSSAAAAAKAYAGKVKSFASKMSALAKKLGVGSGPILQQLVGIAASDIDAGIAGEDALLGMNAADTKTLTGAYADIAKYSDAAGQGVTEGFAKGGSAAANAFVAQLTAQQSKINAQIAGWGTTLTNAMLKPFNLKLDAKGNVVKKAGGGLVVGGQAGADSVSAELMPGEWVSTTASAARNRAALAAGNAGAVLTVQRPVSAPVPAAAAQRVEVTLPRELVVVDTDGALIGRMKVEAGRAVVAHEAAQDRQAAFVGGGF